VNDTYMRHSQQKCHRWALDQFSVHGFFGGSTSYEHFRRELDGTLLPQNHHLGFLRSQ